MSIELVALNGHTGQLTEGAANGIVEAMRKGLTWQKAAKLVGVKVSTVRTWLTRARKGEEPYASFLARCDAASTDAEYRMAQIIQDAAPGDWRAAAWYLERRHGWTKEVRVDASVEVVTRYRELSDEDLDRLIEEQGEGSQIEKIDCPMIFDVDSE